MHDNDSGKRRREQVQLSDSDGSPVREPKRKAVLGSDTEGETPVLPNRTKSCFTTGLSTEGCESKSRGTTGPAGETVVISDEEEEAECVQEEQEEDDASGVLARCEEMAASIRRQLGDNTIGSDRCCLVESDSGGRGDLLVSHDDVVRACGDLATSLKGYQLAGVNFLMLLKRAQVPGAILADEMGLGKTAQTICFLGLLSELEGDPGPHLVVAPASLLENWRRELRQWCPRLRTALYYGSDRAKIREELRARRLDAGSGPDALPPFHVLLTGYSLFERDSADQKMDREFLRSWSWSHMILDEAHALKNRNSSRTARLRRLSGQCARRIMLTGTPLQNDLGELQGLLELLLPGLFEGQELDLDLEEGREQVVIGRMKAILAPFIMRRLKAEVAKQLTLKTQKIIHVDMEGDQAGLYQSTVDAWCRAARAKAKPAEDAGKLLRRVGSRQVKNVFSELRKIAQHPLLVRRLLGDDDLQAMAEVVHQRGIFGDCSLARILEELQTYSDFDLHNLALEHRPSMNRWVIHEDRLMDSAKFRALQPILEDLRDNGSRPLIFSQWTSCLDLISCLLDQMGLRHVRLDGSTQVEERLELCDEFNDASNGVFAFLLSTRAGGQGLNLTGADTVIIHDVDFNPQIDRQAEDRCHRLGQTRPVTVIRLVTRGTVDEGILKTADRKRALDNAVLSSCTVEVGEEGPTDRKDEGTVQSEIMRRILEQNIADGQE